MKNKLKKWPNSWVEHINETCFFYFENKNISFIRSRTICSGKESDAKIYGMQLIFNKNNNVYDIFINYEHSTFIINYYYKTYYSKKTQEENFIYMMDTLLSGADKMGLFNYLDLGGQASRDYITSAYNISQSIENTINYHTDKNDENDDDDDYDDDYEDEGDNDPFEPVFPYDKVESELLCY